MGYSMKNIPLSSRNEYIMKLIEKIESVARRMRWRAYFFGKQEENNQQSENYGFKSELSPPANGLLQPFENDLFELIRKIKFRGVNCNFQKKLSNNLRNISESPSVFVSADKTTNFYYVSKNNYNKLLREHITQDYKKADAGAARKLNIEAKKIAEDVQLEKRIQKMAEKTVL